MRDNAARAALGLLLFAAAFTAFLFALPTPTAVPAAAGPKTSYPAGSFAIVGVRLFDGRAVVEGATVVVREGRVEAAGRGLTVPSGLPVVSGSGKTLLPGLIDGHTHVFFSALKEALSFGVTAELDMFTDAGLLRRAKARRDDLSPTGEADLYSAGTLVTSPGGHGTEYGVKAPTLSSPAEAEAFVAARIAEGSDWIKVVLEDGIAFGARFPSLDRATFRAVVEAAHRQGKKAVVHATSLEKAREALEEGADGLVHVFGDAVADEAFVSLAKRSGAFVTPTLVVIEGISGGAGRGVVDDPRLSPWLLRSQKGSLARKASWLAEEAPLSLEKALESVRRLHAAGIPLLAGTDAPNPGTAHGASLHRELELLVRSGLTPVEALAAATSVPAERFSLEGRGAIAPGARADLVLVDGDPTRDVLASRAIEAIWKNGHPVKRTLPKDAAFARAPEDGRVADFESGKVEARFGAGLSPTEDRMMGGRSRATVAVVEGGANGTARALRVTGEVAPGFAFPWAGVIFFPGAEPMAPVDLRGKEALVFWARGDGRTYRVMLFSEGSGQAPVERAFTAGGDFGEVRMPLDSFPGLDRGAVKGIAFAAGPAPGSFSFEIDEVTLDVKVDGKVDGRGRKAP